MLILSPILFCLTPITKYILEWWIYSMKANVVLQSYFSQLCHLFTLNLINKLPQIILLPKEQWDILNQRKASLNVFFLSLTEIKRSHTGKNQAYIVLAGLTSYNIRNWLENFVIDNSTTNDTLMDWLYLGKLRVWGHILWSIALLATL